MQVLDDTRNPQAPQKKNPKKVSCGYLKKIYLHKKKSKESELWLFKKILFKLLLQSLLTKPYPSVIHTVKALSNPEESKSSPLFTCNWKDPVFKTLSFLEY